MTSSTTAAPLRAIISQSSCGEQQDGQVIRRARRRERKIYTRIAKLVASGHSRDAGRLMRLYLDSFECRLASFWLANKTLDHRRKSDINGQPGRDNRLSATKLVDLARRENLWHHSREMVTLVPIKKANDSYRAICSFRLRDKARQFMLRRLLKLFRDRLDPDQCLMRGGRNAAFAAATDAIRSHGYTHAIELDVRDCYGSFDAHRLHEFLPGIPRRIAEVNMTSVGTNISYRLLRTLPPQHAHPLRKKTQRGIPQGAATSSHVAELLIAKALVDTKSRLSADVRLVIYADNILVLGISENAVREARNILVEVFATSNVGSLKLRESEIVQLSRGIRYLGARIVVHRRRVVAQVARTKREAFVRNLKRKIANGDLPSKIDQAVEGWIQSSSFDPKARPFAREMMQVMQEFPLKMSDALWFARRLYNPMTPAQAMFSN